MWWPFVGVEFFPHPTLAHLFSFLFVLILVVQLPVLSRWWRLREEARERDKLSLPLILLALIVSLAAVLWFPKTGIGALPLLISFVGFAIIIVGFVLRELAVATLGEYFVPVVAIQEGHRVIQKGPYAKIRHPSYTGLILELVGAALAVSNAAALAAVLLLFVPAVLYRISIEEKTLVAELGDEYSLYQTQTKKLIPYVY